jgi:hypothetical protein
MIWNLFEGEMREICLLGEWGGFIWRGFNGGERGEQLILGRGIFYAFRAYFICKTDL